jgi:hypothetical protein
MKERLELAEKIIGLIVGLFAIVTGLVAAYSFLRKKRVAHICKRNGFFEGNWNNQGQIIKTPSHYVDIDAGINKNLLNGYFNVRNAADPNSWQLWSLTGKWHFGKFKCKIQKIIEGKNVVMAEGFLEKKGALLTWNLLATEIDQFPIKALLRRGLPSIG